MSNSQVKNLSKNELKSMLMKMGTSLDKNDHPKSYYEKLYLEKMNAKNKRTRSNNIFGREQILKTKRERNDIKVKEDDEEYVIEEEEEVENNSNQKDEGNSEDENLNEKSEENDQDTEGKKTPNKKLKKSITMEIIERNKNYKESGIKYTRLIPMKKKTEERTKLFVNQGTYINNNIIPAHNNEEIDVKNNQNENEHNEKDINEASPLKQNEKYEENDNIQNNEFQQDNKEQDTNIDNDNKNEIGLKVNENYSSQQKPQIEQQNNKIITFGAPETTDKKYNFILSNGPISFGFNQSANSKNLGNSEPNKDIINSSENKPKKYNTFVKNISDAVKDNIKDNLYSSDRKAKTVLLKWESPAQKEFLRQSIEENDNNGFDTENKNEINNKENTEDKIDVQFNFNERLDNMDNEDENQRKKLKGKKIGYSSYNPYLNQNQDEQVQNKKYHTYTLGQNIQYDDNNDYKSKLRSYNKNKNKFNNKANDEINNEEKINNNNNYQKNIDNPFYYNENPQNNIETNYVESQDIYGNSVRPKDIFNSARDLNPNNQYYNNNIIFNNDDNNRMDQKNEDYNNMQPNDDYMMKNNYRNNRMYDNNYNNNINVQNSMNDNNAQMKNNYYSMLEDKIKYDNKDQNINLNAENNHQEQQAAKKRKCRFFNKISSVKNNIMNKFKNKVYIFPLLLLIVFGIVYFLNNSYERFDNTNIIIVFSIIMGLLILYNLFKYCRTLLNYKRMAKEDKKALLELLDNNNITREELGNNAVLITNFISQRIDVHHLDPEVYIKYVFYYLNKYLKRDGYNLNIEENSDENNRNFWKEI